MSVIASRPLLHARQTGHSGPALVFLHYYGGSARTWAPVIDALPPGQRTLSPDFRGWGQSPGDDAIHTLAGYADDVEAVLAANGITRFVLVGHSMGGKVAQLLASRAPAGLRGLILVAPATPTPLAMPPEARAGLAAAYDNRANVEGALEHMLLSRPLPPALHEQVVEDSLSAHPAARLAWPQVISQEDIHEALAGIRVPSIVISGSADRVDPVEKLEAELMPRLPRAPLHVLPGFGHLLPLEAPTEIAELIGTFLKETAV